jgi:hypothetical protein
VAIVMDGVIFLPPLYITILLKEKILSKLFKSKCKYNYVFIF